MRGTPKAIIISKNVGQRKDVRTFGSAGNLAVTEPDKAAENVLAVRMVRLWMRFGSV